MTSGNPGIIADAARAAAGRRVFWSVLAASCAIGLTAAIHYAQLDLTLSHYDARAHLLVARRVFDSLTPGWRQLGGMWLPLPHLLNLIPVAWDLNYRTGASAVAISIAALAAGLATLAGLLYRRTGSLAAALAAPALIALNPSVLYLQATPMTEPLLIGLSLGAVAAVDAWTRSARTGLGRFAGPMLAALVLTRYEGWLVAAALVGLAAASLIPARPAAGASRPGWRDAAALVAWPAAAILAFLVLSWASTGRLLVTTGFYVADNPSRGRLAAALGEVVSGLSALSGAPVVAAGILGALACCWAARRSGAAALLPLALVAAAVLPLGAFDDGHPFRIRYMVPLTAACGALGGYAVALLPRRVRAPGAAALVVAALLLRPPFDPRAPMVLEAQRESPTRADRRAITRYLAAAYDGTPILASMDSLGHYMQETASIGLNARDFLHEGNGDLWLDAIASPRRHVRWVLIEELAEGGDSLAQRARRDPDFLAGFVRVAEGGGAALYKRGD